MPNDASEQEGENDMHGVCVILNLVASCKHMILNQIMPGPAQHDLRPLNPPTTGDNDQALTILARR